jgi:hypothetical protein
LVKVNKLVSSSYGGDFITAAAIGSSIASGGGTTVGTILRISTKRASTQGFTCSLFSSAEGLTGNCFIATIEATIVEFVTVKQRSN